MARRDPFPGRLAAVLDPPPAPDEPDACATTAPLPVVVPRRLDRWLPTSWRGARLDPGRPGALALLLTAAVGAVVAAFGVWREAPRAEPVADPPAISITAAAPPTATRPTPAPGPAEPLVVAVSGTVVHPGLVRVPAGARVADVLAAAGGPLPGTDLGRVNLARRVGDGEQVAVGVPPAADAPVSGTAPAPSGASGAPVDLNTATVDQLDALPGVGPVMAQRIVDWRTRNGRFASVDQLREVEGIGERRLGQLRELVRV